MKDEKGTKPEEGQDQSCRGNGECERPGTRASFLEQRNGKEVGKVSVSTKERNTMAAGRGGYDLAANRSITLS